ncbi:outer membrane protein MIP precursor [Mariprofundus micogutta]|uniref:Peptidyl-prolyl cis-trans isomerase n=1 Tax=Mariprofundus micogutta TaxID=1921010 RepID=A0A1L8CPY4_9PROT|nr:FKBP-type peptidyl-prolyl cis-trans isomerase [Mariprofundus micogutta]GAV20889.1 outer membrane protein MIP precursor [Mariprofundus micogutta]
MEPLPALLHLYVAAADAARHSSKAMIIRSLIALFTLSLIAGCSSQEDTATDSRPRHEIAAENAAKGSAFMEANAKQPGIVVLPSGMQYKIIREGSGPSAKIDSNVTVDYRGTTIEGREFDSSYARGNPMIFQANRVIPGWTEALQLMQEGSKWQLFIPENLAYGERGAGAAIGPRETLVFEVELLKVH